MIVSHLNKQNKTWEYFLHYDTDCDLFCTWTDNRCLATNLSDHIGIELLRFLNTHSKDMFFAS